MKTIASIAMGVLALGVVSPVSAAQLAVTSYSMPNGDGHASGGTFNYWDGTYNGTGAKTTDGAALSGGTGALTDGVIATQPWFDVSNNAGTGPYVGWLYHATTDPLVTFNFAAASTINEVKVWLDNSGAGGVFAPQSILIDGVSHTFTPPTLGSVGLVDFTGLNLGGKQATIQFDQGSGTWTFVSEVQFFGRAAAVPEPGTWAMVLIGFGVMGLAMRQRRALAHA